VELSRLVGSGDDWAAVDDASCEFVELWAAVDDVELSDEDVGLFVVEGSNTNVEVEDEDNVEVKVEAKAKLLLEVTVL
jgi:hypothetical protein